MKKYTKNYHSSFWMEDFDFDEEIVFSSISERSADAIRKYRLSSARKAIANFVSIATGKNIPVTFATNNSYTDGKSVVISGDIDKPEKFDIGVGLALHEGSHILLSDFTILRDISKHIPSSLFELAKEKNVGNYLLVDMVKNLDNIVEDRRIDNFIYKNAPGYREYYLKLYEHYFGDKTIEKGLESDDFKKENIESYMFRLINLMNKKSNLSSLKGLREIYRILDLKNIDRLKNSYDALMVAISIAEVIMSNIDVVENQNTNQSGESENQESQDGVGESENSDGDANDMEGDKDENPSSNGPSMSSSSDNGEGDDTKSESNESEASSSSSKSSSESLSETNLKKLHKIIKQQKEFLDGDVKKKKITRALENEIKAVENSGSEIVHVGENYSKNYKGCDVIVIKNLTKQMLESNEFGMSYSYNDWKSNEIKLMKSMKDEDFQKAEMMGTIMGKKLQVRNESRETIFNRQKNGKIDGRMISTLGFDNENVFSQKFVDRFKKANIHLSIDASGSMGGKKWRETMINAVALAKATSMISNLEMQISFRYSDNNLPVIVFAYDSRKDSFNKIKSIFPYLKECGTTPEGLTFEAIQKLVVKPSNDLDSFFINISDGEPTFQNNQIHYGGQAAFEHTRKEFAKIKANGIGVLSYFVSDGMYADAYKERFRFMYGSDARFIDINSIGEVTNTLNKMFLTK